MAGKNKQLEQKTYKAVFAATAMVAFRFHAANVAQPPQSTLRLRQRAATSEPVLRGPPLVRSSTSSWNRTCPLSTLQGISGLHNGITA